jgi:hypothetical protein
LLTSYADKLLLMHIYQRSSSTNRTIEAALKVASPLLTTTTRLALPALPTPYSCMMDKVGLDMATPCTFLEIFSYSKTRMRASRRKVGSQGSEADLSSHPTRPTQQVRCLFGSNPCQPCSPMPVSDHTEASTGRSQNALHASDITEHHLRHDAPSHRLGMHLVPHQASYDVQFARMRLLSQGCPPLRTRSVDSVPASSD